MKWIVACLFLMSALPAPLRAETPTSSAYEAMALFTQVLEGVHRGYVDAEEAGYDRLIRHALSGMLQQLDPYSQFLDEEAHSALKDDTSGHFGGVGLVISLRDGQLTVIAPMEDTPAFRAGIVSGDLILEIDGEETSAMSLADAVKVMRGPPGTEVDLKILRPSTRETSEHTITREEIEVASVKGARVIDEQIGYLRITQFSETTTDALKKELSTLEKEGIQALILDLRGNPGGLLSAAVASAELFLPRGNRIVSTRGRADPEDGGQQFVSRNRRPLDHLPLVVLVNRGTASASEILAGALQDHRRAVLIGEKTFGKGSVQSVLPIQDGSAVKLTTARYFTPDNRMIHDKGIEPDLPVAFDPEDLYRIRLRQADPSDDADEEEPLHDPQLEKAVGVLQGVLLFNRGK